MAKLCLFPAIEQALALGATVAVSISGGNDSQAMANELARLRRRRELANHFFALHMDLGRAEWKQTPAHVERIANENDLPLVVVRRPQGDLVQEIQDRMEKLRGTDKPFWPSATNRYCTADQKRSQADKVYRNLEETPFWPSASNRYCTSHHKTNQADKVYRRHDLVVSAEGNRADESPKRRKDPVVSIRKSITAKPLKDLHVDEALALWWQVRQLLDQEDYEAVTALGLGYYARPDAPWRLALTWYAIHDWTEEEVWRACGTSTTDLERRQQLYRDGDEAEALNGWPAHVAYVYGNKRLSCAICILACDSDIRNGARHNPELAETYIWMEQAGGSTFKNGKSLADILAADEKAPGAVQLALFTT